jgi:hypothetical protein
VSCGRGCWREPRAPAVGGLARRGALLLPATGTSFGATASLGAGATTGSSGFGAAEPGGAPRVLLDDDDDDAETPSEAGASGEAGKAATAAGAAKAASSAVAGAPPAGIYFSYPPRKIGC